MGEGEATSSVPPCTRRVTSLDLPGTSGPPHLPFPLAEGGRGLPVTMETAARAFLGGGLRSPRPRAGGVEGAACPTSGSRVSRLRRVLNPCHRDSA